MSEKSAKSEKPIPKPTWVKNSYFWIALILLGVGLYGIFRSENAIRDPGQKNEKGLVFMYFGASALMLLNGVLSHKVTVQDYNEQEGI